MSDNNPTTVRLNKFAQKIKDELAPVYGLKNILSASLLLFNRLSADEQKKMIIEVNRAGSAQKEARQIVDAAEARAGERKQKRPQRSLRVAE